MLHPLKEKIIKIINKRLLRTPGVETLKKNFNSEKNKKSHLYFWLKRSKKNPSFKKFFFEENKIGEIFSQDISNYTFDTKGNFFITEKMLDSLKKFGLLVVRNALPQQEKNNVIEHFLELKNKKNTKSWVGDIVNDIRDESEIQRGYIDITQFEYLNKYSNQATKNIYNKIVKPNTELHYLKLKKILEEKPLRGETLLHSDRFLPHFKMFYSPFKLEKCDAPLEYALGSHKINENYINFFLKSKYFDETDESSLELIKKKVVVTTDENTLYIAFTNGLHKRSAFTKANSERFMMFFQYVERFNKFNYLFN
ncbi:hypothetical protein N9T25_00010 [Candidatus Pelagibacter sp.]|jgi:hypothetical protein|nr:hypothetical protein [Candidatus Pelagibacter sp.]MDB4082184.1 hypothetical protein [Candidatus Pelagibacter sp.]